MTFLKKLGTALVRGVGIVTGFMPAITALSPAAGNVVATASNDLVQLAGVIASIEAVGQVVAMPGAEKAAAAAPLIAQVILQSSLMIGKKIADPVAFNKACQAIGGSIADLLNSLHDDAVKVENKA